MADKPMVVLVATYPNVEAAEADYKAVMALHKEGDLGHVSAGIVTKDAEGKLKIHRHNTTAKHLAWGGFAVGALLAVLNPPLATVMLAGSAITIGSAAATAGVTAGFGGLIGHFWHQIPKDDLRAMGDMLEAGEAGLVVVAVDKKAAELEAVVEKADRKIVKHLEDGDVDKAYDEAVKAAEKMEKIEA